MARKKGNARTAVAYLRVSTEDQRLGPKAQAGAIEMWATKNRVQTVAYFIDQGVSGGAAIEKRPALLDALNSMTALDAGVLIIAKRDRLARDVMYAAMLERMAERSGATIRSADGVGEGDTPEARMMRGIVDLFAEYERLVIGARTKAALGVKKSRGEALGGDAPFGFCKVKGKLVPIEREQKVIERARKLREQGLSFRKVAELLTKQGCVPREGGTFHPMQIARMVAA